MLYNQNAEIALLSCILNAPLEIQGEILESVRAEHFSEGRKKILSIIATLISKKIAANAITVNDHAEQIGELEAIGGPATVAKIATYTSSYGQWKSHFALLEDMRYRREGLAFSDWFSGKCRDMTLPLEEIKESGEARLLKMDFAVEEKDTESTKQAVKDAIDEIQRIYNGENIKGVETGFAALDRLLGGLMPSEFSIWAARPSVGKTASAMQITEHAALNCNKRVVVFSAEMSKGQLLRRQIFSRAKIRKQDVEDKKLSVTDFQRMTMAASALASADIILNDQSSPSIGYIKSMSRRYHKARPVDLIVVDYLQLLQGSTKRSKENRLQEVAEISAGLKEIAKTLNCHVLALAQLNRDMENRKGGKPKLSDLRECGNLEQDADDVVLLWRPEERDSEEEKEDNSGTVEFILAKQRNGPTGVARYYFNAPYTRFEDIPWKK